MKQLLYLYTLLIFVSCGNNNNQSPNLVKMDLPKPEALSYDDSLMENYPLPNPEKEGLVPDKLTATKIAEAVCLPIYGKVILDEKPYIANLIHDSIWEVEGSLPPEYNVGGTFYVLIKKRNGEILEVTHYK